LDQLHELGTGAGLPDDLHVVHVLQGAPDPGDDERVVIGDEDLDLITRGRDRADEHRIGEGHDCSCPDGRSRHLGAATGAIGSWAGRLEHGRTGPQVHHRRVELAVTPDLRLSRPGHWRRLGDRR
jgi:hypothetical protein